jgi:GH3 auxin-responsive promoter
MNKAIELVSNELNITIPEYAVAGIPHQSLFAHRWFIGTDDSVDPSKLRDRIDHHLKVLNDDYAVERSAALRDVMVDVLPLSKFYDWMESKGKVGGQNKFPRVMKNAQLDEWIKFIS